MLVATEGILTARLQQDPLLSGFTTIVIDEFHERSIHADLGIALAKQAWAARDDLRIVVMSATLDASRVAAYLGGARVFDIPGRVHPIDIQYRGGWSPAEGIREVLAATPGQVLCFLPGAGDVNRTIDEIRRATPDLDVLPDKGSLGGIYTAITYSREFADLTVRREPRGELSERRRTARDSPAGGRGFSGFGRRECSGTSRLSRAPIQPKSYRRGFPPLVWQ